jgi:hypothetical protein
MKKRQQRLLSESVIPEQQSEFKMTNAPSMQIGSVIINNENPWDKEFRN